MATLRPEGKGIGESSEILTLDEASALLKVSSSWLRRTACPRMRFGPKMGRYNRSYLLDWFNTRSTRGG